MEPRHVLTFCSWSAVSQVHASASRASRLGAPSPVHPGPRDGPKFACFLRDPAVLPVPDVWKPPGSAQRPASSSLGLPQLCRAVSYPNFNRLRRSSHRKWRSMSVVDPQEKSLCRKSNGANNSEKLAERLFGGLLCCAVYGGIHFLASFWSGFFVNKSVG